MKSLPSKKVIADYWFNFPNFEEFIGWWKFDNIAEFQNDLELCFCCGTPSITERAHIVPKAKGGSNSPSNLFLLCKECHKESPDTVHPEIFWNWVIKEPDSFLKRWEKFVKYFDDVSSRVGPLKIKDFTDALDADSINTHGPNVSLSSIFGLVEYNKKAAN